MNILDSNTTVLGWILLNIPASIGNGATIISLTLATQASAEHRTQVGAEESMRIKAMAAGLNPFFRALGQTIGIVVGQTTFSNELQKKLGPQANLLLGKVQILREQPPGAVVNAVIQSLRVLWWVLFAVAALNLITTYFTNNFSLQVKSQQRLDEESIVFKGTNEKLEDKE